MSWEEDQKIVEGLQEGNEKAFREIYDKYHKQLYGLAVNYLKSKELAEDAVHDVFIKLWNHRKKMKEKGSLKGFLFTSMKNHVLNMIRNRKREIEKNKKYGKLKPSKKDSITAKLTLKNYKKIFQDGLKELPKGKKEIFNMKMQKGISNKKIAQKLDISVNTVKSQYYKASKFIKGYLSEHADLNFD